MSTKNANAKTANKVTATTKTANKAENKKDVAIQKINMETLINSLQNVEIKEKNSLSRKGLYKYSEDELQKIAKDKDESKKIRNSSRRKTDNFLSQIALKLKQKDLEGAKSLAKSFNEYYAERFLLNDFSTDSVRESASLSDHERQIYSVSLQYASSIAMGEK